MSEENIIEMKQERAKALREMQRIVHTSAREKRDMSAPELREFEKNDATVTRLNEGIKRLEADRKIKPGTSARGAGLAERASSSDREFREWFANEIRDFSSAGFGGALVPLDYQPIVWDRLRPQSVFMQTNPTVIDTNRHEISLPHLTADAAASWVAEAGSISETDPTGETITVTPTKVAALTKFSRESADDSNPGVTDIIMRNLMQSIGLAIDKAAFEGTGASNQPTGLKSTSGIVLDNTTLGTNGSAPTNLDFILSALGTLAGNNGNMDRACIAMHSRTWNELTKLKDSQNRYLLNAVQNGDAPTRQIDGVPVFVSNQLSITETQGSASTASSVYVFDASQVILVRREDMRLEATKDAYFANDQIGLRAIARIGLAVPNPLAVVRVAGVL